MKIKYAGLTDRGKKRSKNEDYFFAEFPIFVVADGLGGHRGGEVASKKAVEEFVKSVRNGIRDVSSLDSLKKLLEKSILDASNMIFKESRKNVELHGMGTTISAAVVLDDFLVIAHVGDSRIYLVSEGKISQITKDHTFVQMLIDRGEITEEEAKRHPMKNALLQALGGETGLQVETRTIQLHPQDRVLLCTDGLYSVVSENDILEVLTSEATTEDKTKRLVSLALKAGGFDNVTVILLEVEN
ncbi:MAG: Stp1/IreP family PP2C-type Ser/Thr phosphatase [Actinobacteria bacterium]|nr:Stp1/IreP family PP2C-type Ser/Thr phosphatase [Actinomycetota bacterium]